MKYFMDFVGTIDEKIQAMNSYHRNHVGRPRQPVEFPSDLLEHSVPIEMWSGLRIHSEGAMHAATEYSRQTGLKYIGEGSQFVFRGPQTYQGYPPDNSPRDMSIVGIQLEGRPSNTMLPEYDLKNYDKYGAGHVIWMSQFHNCGFKNFRKLNATWWDGLSISGRTHVQGFKDTPFWIDGAECTLFGNDAYSFMDASYWSGIEYAKPFIRVRARKCTIGRVMITARGYSYQIAVDPGTWNLVMNEVAFDSQDSDPVYGAGLRINGGYNIVGTNLSFKGCATNLPRAGERGMIHIEDGSWISITNSNFERRGKDVPPVDTPLVYVGPKVRDGQVYLAGLNPGGFNGTIRCARRAQVICPDTRLKIVDDFGAA